MLPPAKVPLLPWKVGYPAGKFVVKPGKLAMATARLLQERSSVNPVGWQAERTPGDVRIIFFSLLRLTKEAPLDTKTETKYFCGHLATGWMNDVAVQLRVLKAEGPRIQW